MYPGHDERINIMDEFTNKVHFAFWDGPFYHFYEYFFSTKEMRKLKLKEIYEGGLCR